MRNVEKFIFILIEIDNQESVNLQRLASVHVITS